MEIASGSKLGQVSQAGEATRRLIDRYRKAATIKPTTEVAEH